MVADNGEYLCNAKPMRQFIELVQSDTGFDGRPQRNREVSHRPRPKQWPDGGELAHHRGAS